MFATDRLPNALASAVLDRLSIRELINLQRVNKRFRTVLNKRGIFPRKVARFYLVVHPAQRAEDGGEAEEKNKLWVHDFDFGMTDVNGWSIAVDSQGCTVKFLDANYGTVSKSKVPLKRLIHHMSSRPRSLSASYCNLNFRLNIYEPREVAAARTKDGLLDISPVLRVLAPMKELCFQAAHPLFDNLRDLRSCYSGDAEKITFNKVRTVRCQQCVTRYGDDAPWGCAICEETWSVWGGMKPSRRPQETVFEIEHFPVGLVGQLADQQFAARLRRLHDGVMRVLHEADADAGILAEWMRERHQVKRGYGYDKSHEFRYNFVVDAHHKRFLVAFLREGPCPRWPTYGARWDIADECYLGVYLYIFEK